MVTVEILNWGSNRHGGSTEVRGWGGGAMGDACTGWGSQEDQAQSECIALYQRSANEAFPQS